VPAAFRGAVNFGECSAAGECNVCGECKETCLAGSEAFDITA
jgi:hypothetical protein